MFKRVEDTNSFFALEVSQRQQIATVKPKVLPGLYLWLRFAEFFTRDDWVTLYGLDLKLIDAKAATIYLDGEVKYFEGLAADIRAIESQRAYAFMQTKLERMRSDFIRAATQQCGSPIEQIMLAALTWERYGYETKPPVIWDLTSALEKPQADVVIAPQYQADKHRIDIGLFINLVANEEIKIAIECDGHDFHERTKQQAARDKARNGDLQIAGWRLLRFTGSQIWNHHGWCADRVVQLAKTEIEAQLRRRGLIP
jgi:hypothetical protein